MFTERHRAGLIEALRYGGDTHSIEDVEAQILAGEAQLWVEDSAAIVTEIHDTPRKRVVRFWLATGEKEAVVSLSGSVERWAKSQGCTQATLVGRRGWEKVLAPEGWRTALTVMDKEI